MAPARRIDRRERGSGARAARFLVAAVLALLLMFAPLCPAATNDGGEISFEERAAAEKMSRSRYRKLEVASLIIIFAAGAGAAWWAVRRRNH